LNVNEKIGGYIIKDIVVYFNDQENLKIVPLACMASESDSIEPFTSKKFSYFSSTLIQKGVHKELIVKQLDNQPLISKTKQQIDAFFDSIIPESCMKNPHENENLSLQIEKDWVGILLPLLSMYSEVNNYCAMNSTPR